MIQETVKYLYHFYVGKRGGLRYYMSLNDDIVKIVDKQVKVLNYLQPIIRNTINLDKF